LSTEYYLVGRVRRAHGLRGELVVEALTDAPDAIFAAGRRVFAGNRQGDVTPQAQELHIRQSSPFKGGWIVTFDGINDRSAADSWRDRYLLLPESEIAPPSEGEIFIHDLRGMRVVRASGEEIGEVSAIFELPLLIYFLAMVGLVTHRGLWKFSRWFIVLAFIIGTLIGTSLGYLH